MFRSAGKGLLSISRGSWSSQAKLPKRLSCAKGGGLAEMPGASDKSGLDDGDCRGSNDRIITDSCLAHILVSCSACPTAMRRVELDPDEVAARCCLNDKLRQCNRRAKLCRKQYFSTGRIRIEGVGRGVVSFARS